MGGFWEMSHPPLPYGMVRVKIGFGLSLGLWEGWVGGFPKNLN